MSTSYPLSLLQAISDWQIDSTSRRAKKLKAECEVLPIEFRSTDMICFRRVALPKGGVWDLIGRNQLKEKVSSWTHDADIAKTFRGGIPPQDDGYQGAILSLLPPPQSVIVNLYRLYRAQAFRDAMEASKHAIKDYLKGAGRYFDSQIEVVLEIDSVSQRDIYSLGGYSSPLNDLVTIASFAMYGRPASEFEKEKLLHAALAKGITDGPRWLSMQATEAVLLRTKPQAEALVCLKDQLENVGVG